MKNPIKENRIVSNFTFAVRLKSFFKSVTLASAWLEDEKEAMLNTVNELLNYQIETVTDKEEIQYLKRLNLYPKKPIITTFDGVDIYKENMILFTCMKDPREHEQIITFVSKQITDRYINKNRLFFAIESNCKEYIKANCKKYSLEDLKSALSTDGFSEFIYYLETKNEKPEKKRPNTATTFNL